MIKKILIVRSSSLGDLVHMLPAISDIACHFPDAQIDWVVEDVFQEIPAWHPAVNNVIPISHRKWRKKWWSAACRQERKEFAEKIGATPYDIILDMQALMKSVWVVRQAKGVRHGLDWKSAREPLASLFYDVKHRVKFWQPAITRQRLLASLALNYQYEGTSNFCLQAFTEGVDIQPYAIIMPSASKEEKLWPQDDWHVVLEGLQKQGLALKVLAGNAQETARAEQLIRRYSKAEVLPRMGLTEVANIVAPCTIMVGLDSGLTHLSAALGRPTVGIYTTSTPVRTPLVGAGFTSSLGDRGIPPSSDIVLKTVEQALTQ